MTFADSNSEQDHANFIETHTHSFVVKIWLEEETPPRTWRGHITHVSSGERSHVNQLGQMTAYFAHYLAELGIDGEEEGRA